MSDKPDSESNHRAIVSLREYMDCRMKDLEDKMQLQFDLSQKAIEKAECVTNVSIRSIWAAMGVVIIAIIASFVSHILK